ncbi:exodeoxyribonuclease V subunit gamma [Nocardioides perillae]|uniref:RecBCD enzyme subunit RecC n=1 Tax=Nocardioides perillae TaxID=1119534 RepID=A0A7Y9UUY3_9ACTN|nr:exodeoxyribonuclease V gamma subunit [Nocardioides perillae]
MVLHLHRAERTDLLADALGELLARPLPDPFASEVVVVPARGVERWLTQRLSHRLGAAPGAGDGVCAGVRFLSPRSLVGLLLERDRDDPWDPDRLVWPLLEVVDGCLGEPGFEALSSHLGHGAGGPGGPGGGAVDPRASRRWSVARRLSGLLSSYAVQRPRLVADWRAGLDTDGAGRALDDDLRWQAELWRRLVAAVDHPAPDERHAAALASLTAGGAGLDLPPRLSLFGHTRLPETEVELLRAVGEVRDVHLWLPQASTALWEQLAPTAREGRVARRDDASALLVGHPLLASLGRDARELRRTLGPVVHDEAVPSPPTPATLLGWLQADLRAGVEPSAETRAARVPAADDRSVQVHACHGPARQVDVLREVLVGLLEDDPTLEPRDVLVMCPDIEGYAPLVSAAFGLADLSTTALGDEAVGGHDAVATGHPAHRLRVRLADRAPGATNPLLVVAATLVELAGGRVTATDVLDLAGTEPVRRRFGLDDDDLERVTAWVDEAAVRWGLDGAHRADYGLALDDGTWATGLRRLLVGAAVAGDGHRQVRGVLPLDDVGDGDLELVGRVGELVARLQAFVERAREAVGVGEWVAALRAGMAGLTATDPGEAWQAAQLERELARMGAGGEGEGVGPALRQSDVRALLRHRLGGRPTRSGFRTGTLTVCTMVPMRSVPHRVVCLVGLDDDVFPRGTTVDGDDVLARSPRTGERDPRSEDRQLLLDAVTSATETLVVTYTGRGVHTGLERPPAVPLGELLDAVDRTAADPVRDRVVVHHPLQPHDEQTMQPGRLGVPTPFTFDRSAVAGATAARDPRPAEPLLVREPLPARAAAVPGAGPAPGAASGGDDGVSLADLHDVLTHPVRAFLRHRLRITTGREHEELRDALPLSLDPLEKWAVGDRLVRVVLDGAPPQEAMRAEQLRGTLPPGRLGGTQLDEVKREVKPLVEHGLALRRGAPRTVDVDVVLRDGRRLTGTVGDLFGGDLVRVGYSRVGARHRLAAWVDALALAAGHPDHNWTAHTVGKHRGGAQRALVPPLDDRAVGWLSDLVEVADRALREPLPLPLRTGLAWAEEFAHARRGREVDPDAKGRAEWETPRFDQTGFPREDADAWHVRAFGEHAPWSCLTGPPQPHDVPGEAPHRLGRYAWAVWGPLLTEAGEQVRAL